MAEAPEGIRRDVVRDWQWAGGYEGNALRYVRGHLYGKWVLRESTLAEDRKQATDYVFETPDDAGKLTVAVRMRRLSNTGCHRDLTIRMSRRSGARTEAHKIAAGFGDLYLYGWIDDSVGMLREYVLVDLHRFRSAGLLDNPCDRKVVGDGSAAFGCWGICRLRRDGVLIEHELIGCTLTTEPPDHCRAR